VIDNCHFLMNRNPQFEWVITHLIQECKFTILLLSTIPLKEFQCKIEKVELKPFSKKESLNFVLSCCVRMIKNEEAKVEKYGSISNAILSNKTFQTCNGYPKFLEEFSRILSKRPLSEINLKIPHRYSKVLKRNIPGKTTFFKKASSHQSHKAKGPYLVSEVSIKIPMSKKLQRKRVTMGSTTELIGEDLLYPISEEERSRSTTRDRAYSFKRENEEEEKLSAKKQNIVKTGKSIENIEDMENIKGVNVSGIENGKSTKSFGNIEEEDECEWGECDRKTNPKHLNKSQRSMSYPNIVSLSRSSVCVKKDKKTKRKKKHEKYKKRTKQKYATGKKKSQNTNNDSEGEDTE
jgi:hypothetical protein